jgi:putative transposase
MPYWRLYYHVVWATAGRQPWLVGDRAELVEAVLRKKVHDHHGLVHAAKAMPDHIHLAISLPATGTLASMIGEAKGASSFLVRRRYQDLVEQGFAWQGEYGVVSFDELDLSRIIAYIRNQEAHHRHDNLSATLERDTDPTNR